MEPFCYNKYLLSVGHPRKMAISVDHDQMAQISDCRCHCSDVASDQGLHCLL